VSQLGPLLVTFSAEQIAAYAAASGDRNPIHLDDAFARSVGLSGLIAHGMLQMGLLARVAVDAAGGDPRRLRSLSCRFAAMVRPGDTVTFGGRAGASGEVELWARNQHGEAVLTKVSAEIKPA
jgi:acyl dehydratase